MRLSIMLLHICSDGHDASYKEKVDLACEGMLRLLILISDVL